MPSKLRTALGVGAATAIAAASLVALPTTASAGVTCSTTRNNTPVQSKPWTSAPIINRLAEGTDLSCSVLTNNYYRVGRDGRWIGYVSANFLDTSAG